MDSTTRDMLAEHGLRCTAQRIALFDALRATKKHPTAEDLHHMVGQQAEKMSLATVYNTLEAFCDAGLVRRLPTTDGKARYDADTSPHLHIRMGDSSELRDVPNELGERLMQGICPNVIREIEERLGISIDGLNIQLIARSTVIDHRSN
ncbi:MAG: transcriptional repressor [Planctomycetota bacterium]